MSELALMPESDPGPFLPPDERAGRYLIFRLGHGEFGAHYSARYAKCMEMQPITRVPDAPQLSSPGCMNLRGKVIPVVDLRLTFGLGDPDHPRRDTCVIIVRTRLSRRSIRCWASSSTPSWKSFHLHGPEFLSPEEIQPALGVWHPRSRALPPRGRASSKAK